MVVRFKSHDGAHVFAFNEGGRRWPPVVLVMKRTGGRIIFFYLSCRMFGRWLRWHTSGKCDEPNGCTPDLARPLPMGPSGEVDSEGG